MSIRAGNEGVATSCGHACTGMLSGIRAGAYGFGLRAGGASPHDPLASGSDVDAPGRAPTGGSGR